MSNTTSTPTFSTISSLVTQTGILFVTPTNSNTTLASSSSADGPSSNPNGPNQNFDPYAGPTVYLYGFLAALGLIFVISVTIAYKGYHARRLLRSRVEEAIARGVYVSGYTEEELQSLGRGRRGRLPIMSIPLMHENWVNTKRLNVDGIIVAPGWNIKPTSIAAIRPYDPPPPPHRSNPHSNPSSILQRLVDPLREFWFVPPPEGAEPGQLQGRPSNPRSLSTGVQDTSEHEVNLSNAEGISIAVIILMPNAEHPASEESNGSSARGRPSQGGTAPFHPTGSSGVASTSTHGRDVDVQEVETLHQGDLPDLIMGTARIGIAKQEEPSIRDDREADGS